MPQPVHTKRGRWSPAGILNSTGEPQLLQKFKGCTLKILVPGEGIEPTRCHHHRILSPARLPVPPSGHQTRQYMRLELLVEWSADAARGLSLRSSPGSHGAAASGDPLRQPDVAAGRRHGLESRPAIKRSSVP